MADLLEVPSPLELRDQLQQMVIKDLLGPAGGPEEIIEEPTVRGRYILGLLAPRGQSTVPDEQDELAVDGSIATQDGKPASPVPQASSMLPSSIGITFSVAPDAEAIQVTARWGRYYRAPLDIPPEVGEATGGEPPEPNEVDATDDGAAAPEPAAPARVKHIWKRKQIEGISDRIPLKAGPIGPWCPDPSNQEVYVRGLARRRADAWAVTLFLINAQTEPKTSKDGAWVFQPELIVRHPQDQAVFVKRRLPTRLSDNHAEDRMVSMLYRRQLEFAVGHGVGVSAAMAPGEWEHAVEVRTDVIPSYEVERMEAPSVQDIPELKGIVLDMQTFAGLSMGEFDTALGPLAGAYEKWLQDQEPRLQNPAPDLTVYILEGQNAVRNGRQTLARIRAGIALLDSHEQAAEAFRFANLAMAWQRVRTIYTRLVRQGEKPALEEIDVPHNRSWRPFQLAFLLLNLPGLVDPTHPDRSKFNEAKADLLWFPTGGGKTEAYLGVAAFAMAIRRLQGNLGGYSGAAGVTVLMRYTLRLLTLQQFQRATALMCACEMIRRQDPAKWGAEPFRIGLWVGERSTPNWTEDAAEIIKQDHDVYTGGAGGKGTPAQLTNCPWCGNPINPGVNIVIEQYPSGRARTFQYCSDPYGNCPFSKRQSPDEGLPIVVVDEEIYRRLPTLLIATVDKFAQLPWKGETQMLFGRVSGYCPRHGFRSPEINDADSHNAVRTQPQKFPAVKTQPAGSLRPPDLIIQDELHLISGPLGTLVGLYETAVDELSTWDCNGHKVYPKVIASTATIRRARDQVYSLFMREVTIFPPSGLDAEDNFFSRRVASTEKTPARRYIGICAPGTRLKSVLIRVYAAFMAAAQVLYDRYGRSADPWMTTVGYFNSLRDLGGMRRVVDDALRTRLRNMDERGLAQRFIGPWGIEELTSRKSATDIPRILDRLESVFDPGMEAERRERSKAGERLSTTQFPLDVVLATNMISVGVDVSRLGLMIVASQPKATAEYIQATSRVGRAFPGLVCTVYNWARPRDLSHYERFTHYHATFYQQVEALSVTPFSLRALDRGLSAVLASYLRLLGVDFNSNAGAGKIKANHAFIQQALDSISQRAAFVSGKNANGVLVRQIIQARLDEWLSKAQNITPPAVLGYKRQKGGLSVPLLLKPEDHDWQMFTCLNSLRDVEPEVPLVLRDYGMDREPGAPPLLEEVDEGSQ